MRILIIASYAFSLLNFRGELIQELVMRGHVVTAVSPEKDEDVKRELEQSGVGYRRVPMRRTGLNPFQDIFTIFLLVIVMRKFKPEKIILYTVKPIVYGSIAAGLIKCPCICSIVTGAGFVRKSTGWKPRLLNFLVKLLYKVSLKKNKIVFFQNSDDKTLFMENGLIQQKTETIVINGSGINTEKYFYTISPTKPITFLLIGRMITPKGIYEFVEAAEIIKKEHADVQFHLVGGLELSHPLAVDRKKIESWTSSGLLIYWGETKDVRPNIKQASVYVLPSYHEGTPRSVLEAMSMGRPVITTNSPGCRETVENGLNGFLVPVGDSHALADAMRWFILNPECIQVMGMKSREIAVHKYNVHKVNTVILEAMGL